MKDLNRQLRAGIRLGGLALGFAAFALAASGCRTRLWELVDDFDGSVLPVDGPVPMDARPPRDLFVSDLLGDLWNTDLRFADLQTVDMSVVDAAPADASFTPPFNCGVQKFVVVPAKLPDLLIVQDHSGSMNDDVNDISSPPPGQSKWALMVPAIEQVVLATTSVNWGLELFGWGSGCDVAMTPQVTVGPDNGMSIKNELDTLPPPDARTPTALAISTAVKYFAGLVDGRSHYILLATDGEPGCGGLGGNDDAAAEQAVLDAANAGVHTFVVGIGNTTMAKMALRWMAINGGEPSTVPGIDPEPYYSVNSTQDLVDVLQNVAGQIGSCAFPLQFTPNDPNDLTIHSSDGYLTRDATHLSGWDYGLDQASVVFFGTACTRIQSGALTDLEAILACPPDQ